MQKNYKIFNLNHFYFKKLILLNQNIQLFGKNKIIFNKSNYIFNKISNNNIYIYKGNKFRNLNINKFHFSMKFGFFCFTRKPFKYIQKVKTLSKFIKR